MSLEWRCPRPLSRLWEGKKLVESNSGSSEYFPVPGNAKQAKQAERGSGQILKYLLVLEGRPQALVPIF